MLCSPRWTIVLPSAKAQGPMQQSRFQMRHFQGADSQMAPQMVCILNSIGLHLLWFFRRQKRVIGGHEKVVSLKTNLSVSNFTRLAENFSDITSVIDIAWISCLLLSLITRNQTGRRFSYCPWDASLYIYCISHNVFPSHVFLNLNHSNLGYCISLKLVATCTLLCGLKVWQQRRYVEWPLSSISQVSEGRVIA